MVVRDEQNELFHENSPLIVSKQSAYNLKIHLSQDGVKSIVPKLLLRYSGVTFEKPFVCL